MPSVDLQLPHHRYSIEIEPGALSALGEQVRAVAPHDVAAMVIDENVADTHAPAAKRSLEAAGFEVVTHTLPAGEAHKTLDAVRELYDVFVKHRLERKSPVVALSGGVIGDTVGFAAASYLRGVPLVQCPTTLLAMVDSAVGGKTGVNLPAGKNLVGAFHQPRAVIADITTLTTLPRRALIEGFAEVIKHALILDPELLKLLQGNARALTGNSPDLDLLTEVTARSVRLKALIVSSDPEERGLRAILNYGHTIGHAIETVTGYTDHLHGEAVSIGMMGAARIAQRMGLIGEDFVASQADVLRSYGLPLQAQGLASMAILDATRMDKKVRHGRPRFILLEAVGHAAVRDDVPDEVIEETIRSLVAP